MRLAVNVRLRMSRYTAGITIIESRGAVIMPPTIGAAMRRMISDPVPLPHMMGRSPATITATVIAIGRTRRAAPSMIACERSRSSLRRSGSDRAARAWLR